MSKSADALRLTRPFAEPSYHLALWQLLNTLGLFIATIGLMFWVELATDLPYAVTLLLSLVAAIAYLRLFMIGHDTAHDAYLPKRWENIVVGNLMGILTNTPVAYWGRQHHIHHQGNGNLDKRGDGDVEMMTVDEFETASPLNGFGIASTAIRSSYLGSRHRLTSSSCNATRRAINPRLPQVGNRSWARISES